MSQHRIFYLNKNLLDLNSIWILASRLLGSIFALLLPLGFSPGVNAQSFGQLDYLIFEPVLIDPGNVQDLPLPGLNNSTLTNGGIDSIDSSPEVPSLTREEINRNIRSYQEQITDFEGQHGPFSIELFQTLIDLGTQYQLLGDHLTAIEIFERAEYISRINEGLDNPEQFISIEKAIESYLAMGDIANANRKQSYLLFLSEEHYGVSNLETLPTLLTMAERNMTSFNTTLVGPIQPTISFNASANSPFGGRSRTPSGKEMAFGSLNIAQLNYYRAIGTMLDNQAYFDPLLLDLEYKFLETLFLQTFRSAILRDYDYYLSETRKMTGSLIGFNPNRRYSIGYSQGENVFERLLIYIGNNPRSNAAELADALMEYGDWNTLFNRGSSARKKYSEAWQVMEEAGADKSVLEEFFRPDMPVHLPRFTAKPNSREKFGIPLNQELNYEGYVDIAFTISKYGRAKKFEILATEGNISKPVERRLRRYLRNSPFRPRLDEEGKSIADRVTLRYLVANAGPAI